MIERIQEGGLQVTKELWELINNEIAPGTGIEPKDFWLGFETILNDLSPKNRNLLKKRDILQEKIDAWHSDPKNRPYNPETYKLFLEEIGYLLEEGTSFKITTQNVDTEISHQAGPQLVVPVKNARFALNAANSRWGSLYDALYGTDAISDDGGAEQKDEHNPLRGAKVISFGRKYLDNVAALSKGSHQNSISYKIINSQLEITLKDGTISSLLEPEKCLAYQGDPLSPQSILLKNNGLHVEIQIDKKGLIGENDLAGVQDLLVEAAITTIMDCEDSVAAVDSQDKVEVYRNWLGLMKGTLSETFNKAGKTLTRSLNEDRHYTSLDGSDLYLHGRSLLFVRNVGHLMSNSAILDKDGNQVPEGIMDDMINVFSAMHDLNNLSTHMNSRSKSIYIVKPKMHGPEEVAFTTEVFSRIEETLGLKKNTIKLGIMDEERRTTVNLKESIRQASERIAFINTGFLDRTGDEIHTSMLAGAIVPKTAMKQEVWIKAYEDWNVDIGLECGLSEKAQIGKGMWAMPEEMAAMLEQKIAHLYAGASTAWVPSPTAAVLHSTHYHQVNVFEIQKKLALRPRASLDDILHIPLIEDSSILTPKVIKFELDNNAQGILGYVVRWIEQGVGCSKVPDIENISLMEDRATLRISSQHIANWLEHGVCTQEQVMESMKRMATIVDEQNSGDIFYENMAPEFNNIAFRAACDLIFKAKEQPSGYTEPLLHSYREMYKMQDEA